MTPRHRFVLALALTAIAVGGVLLFALVRFAEARERGAAGLTYIERTSPKQPEIFGLGPGDILMVLPGSAADRAGIRRGDTIVAIESVPIDDVPRLAEVDARIRKGDVAVYRGAAYEERETALAAGDRIVLFTDGVSEATDSEGEMFGEQRLEELVAASRTLGAAALKDTIVQAATAFSGGDLEDDVTLVVVAIAEA